MAGLLRDPTAGQDCADQRGWPEEAKGRVAPALLERVCAEHGAPYMHAFVAHLVEFVHLYKDINAFNCQGLEKLDDMTTGQFFKGTNKQETALHQILKRRNRMEFFSVYVDDEDAAAADDAVKEQREEMEAIGDEEDDESKATWMKKFTKFLVCVVLIIY